MKPAMADETKSGNWPTARDSWVDDGPDAERLRAAAKAGLAHASLSAAPSPPDVIDPFASQEHLPPASKSLPPPLPSGTPMPMLAVVDPVRVELMIDLLAENDYEGALLAAQTVLSRNPHHQDAIECAEMSARELWKVYVARLGGSIDRVPRATIGPDTLPHTLNRRASWLLARVDGVQTIATIVERAGLPPIDALRGLAELYLCAAIRFV
jgi:hypothetical protein